jgi:hypothetical protein
MSNFDASAVVESIFTRFSDELSLGWVWEQSPLGPRQTLLTVMHMVTTGQKRYRSALRQVFQEIHRSFGWEGRVPTPSALTQARGKLTEKRCRDLFRLLLKEARHVKSHAQLRYARFDRLVAVDGTKVTLRSNAKLKRAFGCPAGDHLAPQALLSVLWDLGGNVPVDWRIGRYDDSETGHLRNMLGALTSSDLLLADRLYPSRDLISELNQLGINYVMRVKTGGNCLKEVDAFLKSGADDVTVELEGFPGVFIRLVRAHRPGSEHIVLITSLSQVEHSPKAIADLYQRRWGIETAYREGKSWLGLDELPGRDKQQIRHEVAALMIFWLMQGELEGQAREVYADEIRAQEGVDPDWSPAEGIAEVPVRFNRPLAATSTAIVLAAAVTSETEAIFQWQVSIRYLWQNRSRRRPGRSFRRTSQRPHRIRKRDDQSIALAKGGRAKDQP